MPVCPAVRACACARPGCRRRRYPSDTTDAEWALIAPLLPVSACQTTAGGRPEAHCRRAVVDAIRYVVHNGCVWRAMPADFPPWRTVYGLYQRWNATGATLAVHDALRGQARRAAGRTTEPTAAVIRCHWRNWAASRSFWLLSRRGRGTSLMFADLDGQPLVEGGKDEAR